MAELVASEGCLCFERKVELSRGFRASNLVEVAQALGHWSVFTLNKAHHGRACTRPLPSMALLTASCMGGGRSRTRDATRASRATFRSWKQEETSCLHFHAHNFRSSCGLKQPSCCECPKSVEEDLAAALGFCPWFPETRHHPWLRPSTVLAKP